MVGGALMGIVFVCTLVCWVLWTVMYSIFAAHYFLTTLTDSSSGQDEVQFPREAIFDWWWKPLLCAWILLVWLIPSMLLFSPLAFVSTEAYLITWGLFLWFVFPMSLSCNLYAQNWLVFLHGGVLSRMLRHFGPFIYVHVLTFALFACCIWLIKQMLTDAFWWVVPAVVLIPATLLLYARHWGRFAWLSLNFLPGRSKSARGERVKGKRKVEDPWAYAEPEPEPAPAAESKTPAPVADAVAPAEVDEWTDMSPYQVVDDPSLPSLVETKPTPVAPAPAQAPAAAMVEEEDEWATEKKPYNLSEPETPASLPPDAPPDPHEKKSDANEPITMTKYFDERARKEKIAAEKAEEAKRTMPAQSKMTPTFTAAMVTGVWPFMVYHSTLIIWGTMIALTLMELLLLFMLKQTYPFK